MRDSLGGCGNDYRTNPLPPLRQCPSGSLGYSDPTTDPPVSGGYCIPCFHALAGARLRALIKDTGAEIPHGTTDEQLSEGWFGRMRRDAESWAPELARLTKEVADTLPGGQRNPEFIDRLIAKVKNHLGDLRNDDTA